MPESSAGASSASTPYQPVTIPLPASTRNSCRSAVGMGAGCSSTPLTVRASASPCRSGRYVSRSRAVRRFTSTLRSTASIRIRT